MLKSSWFSRTNTNLVGYKLDTSSIEQDIIKSIEINNEHNRYIQSLYEKMFLANIKAESDGKEEVLTTNASVSEKEKEINSEDNQGKTLNRPFASKSASNSRQMNRIPQSVLESESGYLRKKRHSSDCKDTNATQSSKVIFSVNPEKYDNSINQNFGINDITDNEKNRIFPYEQQIPGLEKDKKLYSCTLCDKIYRSRENLTLHHMNIHLKHKPYSCKYCSKRFSHRNGKLYHEKNRH